MAGNRIVIVGGGTAGWLTAAFLAKALGANRPGGASITLVESPDIGIIGVGEGTFPTIRATLATLGVSEARFLRESSATFKQGVLFRDWERRSSDGKASEYFHPFNVPVQPGGRDLSPYWLLDRRAGSTVPFAEAVTNQIQVVAHGLGPKRLEDPDFQGPMNYAYHFDAVRFADFLRGVAKDLGVVHLTGKVETVQRDGETGDIASVTAGELGVIEGDLFIDCSGFRALLIGETLGVPFKRCDDVLFNDRALAVQVPYATPDAPIAPYTLAAAHEAGWTWDIGLENRRGVGYVFSSRHSDEARAEEVLRAYVGKEADPLPVRLLKFQTGYRETQWVGNCVAVGLSAGFFEPLESTGIMLIEAAAMMIADTFPLKGRAAMEGAARNFSSAMSGRFERIVAFLKLHYCLSKREEPYWRDNADPASWPQGLRDMLAQWAHRPVSRFDFVVDLETFLPASYQFILYGMNAATDFSPVDGRYPDGVLARQTFEKVAAASTEALKHLPVHRKLVEAYYAR
ncbi:tryptophan halogenase family protein [Caulobacter sp. DWP3-1-3b2]|uniref:tryptophan halogenase family protein n=1 Tax=Caulobacter sp. DWP3-1-3b2 TaxID=2804643 RepID=UPI003CF085F3